MQKMLSELLDRPAFSLLASAASSLTSLVADASGLISGITACAGAGTAVIIFLWWLRKFVIQALHDLRAFRRGKLPPVDVSEPRS